MEGTENEKRIQIKLKNFFFIFNKQNYKKMNLRFQWCTEISTNY